MSWLKLWSKWRPDFRRNLQLAWPVMLSQAGQVSVNFIDNIMLGQVGSTPLAAISLGNAIFVLFLVVGLGLSFALTPLVAEAIGADNRDKIKFKFIHSLLINLVFGLFSVLAIWSISGLIRHMNQPEEVVPLAIEYLNIVALSLLPFMAFQSFRTLAEGLSQTKLVFGITLAGNLINFLLNYVLIFGHWGFPPMGIAGAAIGTVIARCFMLLFIFLAFRFWGPVKDILHQEAKRLSQAVFRRLLHLGVPSAMSMLFEVSAFSASAFIIGGLGESPLAAHQIAINLASITFLMATGFAIVSTIRVGNGYGMKDRDHLMRAGYSALAQVFIFMLVCGLLFVVFRQQLPKLYIDDEEIVSRATGLILIAALFQIVDGLQVVAMGTLRGLQDVLVPSIITFVAYWVIALPLGYYLGHYTELKEAGVWIGLWMGLTVAAIFLVLRFRAKSAAIQFEPN